MRWIALIFLLGLPFLTFSQIGWVDGSVITNSGDTLKGKIYHSTPGQRSAKCFFKEEGYNDKVKYRPFTIRGYMVKGNYYISRIFDIHPSLSYGLGTFMNWINYKEEGPLMLLKYRNTDFEYGFYQTFLVKKGNPSYEINFMKFRKSTAAFFSDYPALQEDILNKKYKKKDLPEIVKRYNNWYLNER